MIMHATKSIFFGMFAVSVAMPTMAHEFWIAPSDYMADENSKIEAELLVGMDMVGAAQIYITSDIQESFRQLADQRKSNEGRLGNRPAIQTMPLGSGLHVLAHVTTAQSTSYEDMEKFEAFLKEKDLLNFLDAHQARELPEKNFTESYVRHAKSLIVRGSADGQDQYVGLRVELVAKGNPYDMKLPGEFSVMALEHGKPVPQRRVTVQSRDDQGNITRDFAVTDDTGMAKIMIYPGREYLLDLVTMEQTDPETNQHKAPWRSHWASLTFRTPRIK